MQKIKTDRFGELDLDAQTVINFPAGLPAFEDERKFIFILADQGSPYTFMQSVQTPSLTFLIANPFAFFSDYQCEIDDETLGKLAVEDESDVAIYALATVPSGDVHRLSLNLLAPIVVNKKTGTACQIVLEGTAYTTKHQLYREGGEA